jgi:hypothetical protein
MQADRISYPLKTMEETMTKKMKSNFPLAVSPCPAKLITNVVLIKRNGTTITFQNDSPSQAALSVRQMFTDHKFYNMPENPIMKIFFGTEQLYFGKAQSLTEYSASDILNEKNW